MKFESIKVETDRIIKVRNRVKETRQTISGFIALAIDEKLKRESIPFFGEGVKSFEGTEQNVNAPTTPS